MILEDEFYLLKVDMTSTKCVKFYFKVPGIAELLKYIAYKSQVFAASSRCRCSNLAELFTA